MTTPDEHLHLPVLPAAQRRRRSRTCPTCGAPVDVRRGQPSPAGSSSRRSRTWPGSSSASPTCRSRAPCRSPTSTSRRATGSTSPTTSLLWTDPQVQLANMSMKGAWKRMLAGLPLVMMEARGPGHIALSDNHAGRDRRAAAAARPGDRGARAPVPGRDRQRQLRLVPDRTSGTPPARATTARRTTRWASTATSSPRRRRPGCCCSTRRATRSSATCAPGETLLVQPSSLLYRDVSVRMQLHLEYPRNLGLAFWRSSWSYRTIWLRLFGPGRVAVQSVYEPAEESEAIHRLLLQHHQPPLVGAAPRPLTASATAGS